MPGPNPGVETCRVSNEALTGPAGFELSQTWGVTSFDVTGICPAFCDAFEVVRSASSSVGTHLLGNKSSGRVGVGELNFSVAASSVMRFGAPTIVVVVADVDASAKSR